MTELTNSPILMLEPPRCPYCQTEISIKAVRCPHCTSKLEGFPEINA